MAKKKTRARRPARGEPKFGRKRREDAARETSTVERGSKYDNAVSWYAHNPSLLADAASFPFPNRPGMEIPVSKVVPTISYKIPGILGINWGPSIGISNSVNDPASILGKEIYSRVRNAFSGSLEADAPDYVMYILALDSIFSYIATLKRFYRVMVAWTPDNRLLPEGMLEVLGGQSSGANYTNLYENRVRFHQIINELVLMTRKFVCPADFDYINRHYWMNDNVYTDRASVNAQMYAFVQQYYYRFAMLNDPQNQPAPGLEAVTTPFAAMASNVDQVKVLYDFGLNLISALAEWDDCYTINGYLQRAYQGGNTFMVDELPFDSVLVPAYSEEVLMQIENSISVPVYYSQSGVLPTLTGLNITQNPLTNAVLANPFYYSRVSDYTGLGASYAFAASAIKPLINLRVDAATPALNVEATRLQTLCTAQMQEVPVPPSGTADQYRVQIVSCASEICLGYATYGLAHMFNSTRQSWYLPTVIEADYQSNGTVTIPTDVNKNMFFWLATQLDAFDWHPILRLVSVANTDTSSPLTVQQVALLGDVANITSISDDDLANLHRVCLYSELNSFTM